MSETPTPCFSLDFPVPDIHLMYILSWIEQAPRLTHSLLFLSFIPRPCYGVKYDRVSSFPNSTAAFGGITLTPSVAPPFLGLRRCQKVSPNLYRSGDLRHFMPFEGEGYRSDVPQCPWDYSCGPMVFIPSISFTPISVRTLFLTFSLPLGRAVSSDGWRESVSLTILARFRPFHYQLLTSVFQD